ncbi:MAG: D-allulose-6-phosphate 3-epimerase [Pirellulales bacterium]|nr:D-allulose-6-phosphate 3-epimerase [Pirellulales bacterium]
MAVEMDRVEAYSDCFHLDVADGHYTPTMLFFPDLVAQLRERTSLPMEVHLMTTRPLDWIEPFHQAGADGFIFCHDSLTDVPAAINAVKQHGKKVGISLGIDEQVELLDPYWNDLDLVTICGTAMGVKGAGLHPSIPEKICRAHCNIARAGAITEVQADGGIREHTVPLLAQARADWIVPGSLMFKGQPAELRLWLASLIAEHVH